MMISRGKINGSVHDAGVRLLGRVSTFLIIKIWCGFFLSNRGTLKERKFLEKEERMTKII